ncbi:hypothetical protein GCM10008983_17160 [Lentibacillus halophilus]|uniref:Lipoprotein n=1 Tax=Lentibacillus halophilus TaxID=295065 RepID=A0ABN0ZAN4_9BACI
MKKRYIILSIITLAILIVPIFITTNYFFNPITFENDAITNRSWWHYKKPITIEFNNQQTNEKHKFTDQEDVTFIFKKLKNSPKANVDDNYIAPIGEEGKNFTPIAKIKIRSNQKNLGVFFVYTQKVFKVSGREGPPEYYRITSDLWNFLNKG